ncbi:light-harvesting protein [Roseovarius aestuariivivens]|uniref:light-harvesting protein n=1 Tax=Roseovarius aestuariivivens TaxID=1888910 RepID=UPI001081C885|nr:light-harvesting protein [Roseovarius aestuariivivens]
MNNAKLWLVVSPNVGIPIFLGAVAVSSFAVHLAIIKNTSWIESYHQGTGINADSAALTEEGATTSTASYAIPSTDGGTEITVILPDGTHAKAILQPPERMASARQ